jgi:hypothetical protein
MPSRLIFPIGVHHIRSMLDLVGLTIVQRRDMLICVVGTVMCLRVNEVDQLQICDVMWYLDAAFHAKYRNTFAYKRKQDTARKGLYPRAGPCRVGELYQRTLSWCPVPCVYASLPESGQRGCDFSVGLSTAGDQRGTQLPAHDWGRHQALQRQVHAFWRHRCSLGSARSGAHPLTPKRSRCALCSAELHDSKGPPRSLRDIPRLWPPTVTARAQKHDGAWRV